ncbi:hypothetical protein RHMOL_Rhmol09G0150900 [Rhododendron molle]|uniref:Uncharacterized protein n=1 Tax=Rhododendron molle TaxID=49168 RepID=A0ACC0MFB7_RHOML|nr:hypothetical protein RHMOL_Rhmol09G0150900 [Rhododendron molle]
MTASASIVSLVTKEELVILILNCRAAGVAFEEGEIRGDCEEKMSPIKRMDVTGKSAIVGFDKVLLYWVINLYGIIGSAANFIRSSLRAQFDFGDWFIKNQQ